MGDSIRQERTGSVRRNPWPVAAVLTGMLAVGSVSAQQPQFGQGFGGTAGQAAPRDPAETSAYSSAISQQDPNIRVSAIQQFLVQYPNSPLRQPAIAQMMLAKRAAGAPSLPATNSMSRPMASPGTNAGLAPVAGAAVPVAAAAPVGTPRDSLLQHPAKPAQVRVSSDSLTIKADNSSLSQILHEISASTGMKIEGLGQDERIFGSYGPGEQREVLLSLLEGSGYNVLMVGDDRGAPRELNLSQRSATNTVNSGTVVRNNREEEDDEIEQEQPQPQPEQAMPANQPPPGPDGTQQPRNPGDIQEMLRQRQQQQQQTPQQTPQ